MLWSATEQRRGPPVTDVGSHGLGLRHLEVSIDDVGQVWEVEAEALLVLFAPLCFIVCNVVALVNEVNTGVLKQVPVDVASIARSDVPIAKNWS